ncbi:hypothetical protein HMPREF9225_0090 [Peptoniphilus duerdenii ATCC BAA-1640]|uniref:DUF1828 domain-containing protein n=1 Tax=Peptoniphilus duerdenii ATCC BAA-1640 TaxID=862517 RepID=E0NIV1_9FIRM|nr:DUF1828 domain-containing protein [Peptoniphilus duerdenii]EFM26281.1 hypothetical protein HMPREF9225_0090 [Peptoniphilus duerdenii ATCC BAA-1640]
MTMQGLKTQYLDFLNNFTSLLEINNTTTRITTPFLDSDNDLIEIYIEKKESDTYYLTDDGITLADLAMKGVSFDRESKRLERLNKIASDYGVTATSKEICATSNMKDLPLKLYFLSQAIQKVSDLYVLNRPFVHKIFYDDVKTFLETNNVRYAENVIFMGKSNIATKFDFVIPKSKNAPDRLIQTCSSIELGTTRSYLFGWIDIMDKRKDNSKLYIIYDDTVKKPSTDVESAITSYGGKAIPWSEINKKENKILITK